MPKNKTFKYYSPKIKPKPETLNQEPPIRKSKSAKKPQKRKKDPFYMSWSWRKIRLKVIEEGQGRCSIIFFYK